MNKLKSKHLNLFFVFLIVLLFYNLSYSGTVATQGDTDISIGGSITQYFFWDNNQPMDATTANNPSLGPAQTSFTSTTNWTRLHFALNNKTEGIKGFIEGDFVGGLGNPLTSSSPDFRLRHAYFVKEFNLNTNYTPWLLIGQTWGIGTWPTFTLNTISGEAGANEGYLIPRVPTVAFGVKMDFNNIKINPEIAFQDQISNILSGSDYYANQTKLTTPLNYRSVMPAVGIRIPVTFDTSLGAPTYFELDTLVQPIKINKGYAYKGGPFYGQQSKTSWLFGAHLTLPVKVLTFKADISYNKGLSGFDSFIITNSLTPASYWVDSNGGINTTNALNWDLMAKINIPNTDLAVAAGYSQVIFSHYNQGSNTALSGPLNGIFPIDGYVPSTPARKASSIFVNLAYNLTKSTTLGIQYDRNKTYYAVKPHSSFASNQILVLGEYDF